MASLTFSCLDLTHTHTLLARAIYIHVRMQELVYAVSHHLDFFLLPLSLLFFSFFLSPPP